MTTWFPLRWRWGGAIYVGLIAVLAGYAMTGDRLGAYYTMLVLTLPFGYLMILPIYLAASVVDSALGYGMDGSPASLAIAIAGFAFAAALQVVMLRFLALTISTIWAARQQDLTRHT